MGEGASKSVFAWPPGAPASSAKRGSLGKGVVPGPSGARASHPKRRSHAAAGEPRSVAWRAGSLAAAGESCSDARVRGVGELADRR